MPRELTIKGYEDDLKKGGRLYSTKIVRKVIEEDEEDKWDPSRDPTLEEWEEEKLRKKGLSIKAPTFVPGKYGLRVKSRRSRKSKRRSRKSSRKSTRRSRKASRKVSRKSTRRSRKASRKVSRKSRKVSRRSRKVSRRSRKVSRRSRKVSRRSRKASRKSRKVSRKSTRKSRKVSRRRSMGRRERSCKNLLKEKVGKNLKEYEDGRYVSRKQAIAVSYNQVKNMKPSCGKYFKRKD